MIVVSDTSPLNYLLQIDRIDVLRRLYGKVYVPHEVHDELLAHNAPSKVQAWALHPPDWLAIRSALPTDLPELDLLDIGERAAIYLALEIHADRLLADETKARRVAVEHFHRKVTGTLGVLIEAHRTGLLDGRKALEALCRKTNFYATPELQNRFIASLSKPS
jgi:predicted nucleic acid-binding protein